MLYRLKNLFVFYLVLRNQDVETGNLFPVTPTRNKHTIIQLANYSIIQLTNYSIIQLANYTICIQYVNIYIGSMQCMWSCIRQESPRGGSSSSQH